MLKTVEIKDRVISTLDEFVADWGHDATITGNTALVADLGFDSIDVIQLFVEIERSFGQRNLGFQSLLMQDGRYVDDLTVSQISDFLEDRMAAAA